MKEKLPINVDVLKWARTSLKLSLEDVARRFKKDEEEITSWETGETSPTYPQLERLAHEIYKRPVAVFFFPNIPEEEDPKTEFRTLPDNLYDELPPEIIKLYRKAKAFQLNLDELYENKKPVEKSLIDYFRLDFDSPIEAITNKVREALGISMAEQTKWKKPEVAFKHWREALEANGVFVFKDAFKNKSYSGFCLFDERYPIIFVNNSSPHSRQVFTLFHELAHLLFRSGGIDFRSNKIIRHYYGELHTIEVMCNRFSNEILVPARVFSSFKIDTSESHIEELAEYFAVSREVILRNYLDRGIVEKEYYENMSAKWAAQVKKNKEGGGMYHNTMRAYLGDNYINLTFSRYYQNKISIDALSDYLMIKPGNLPNFEHFTLRSGPTE